MIKSLLRTTAYLAIFLFFLFTAAANLSFTAHAQEDQLKKAEDLSNEMLYEEAIKILNDFIQANASNPGKKTAVAKAYYLMAKIYFDVDEKDPKVKENLAKVYQYDPAFSTEEINAAFKKMAEEAKTEPVVKEVPKVSKMQLTVDISEGASGSPAEGTYSYSKDKRVRYNYSARRGAANLTVHLDGKSVPAKGTITMDENHTLTVSTTSIATVIVNSEPSGANIYVDGNDTGHKTGHTFIYTSEVSHTFLLRKVGYKDFQTTLKAGLTQTKNLNRTLEKGLRETFDRGTTSSILWQWQPNPAGKWAIRDGKYTSTVNLSNWDYSIYNYNFASSQYTLTVKMKRTMGKKDRSNAVALVTGPNPTAMSGYLFNYTAAGYVSIFKISNFNFNTGAGAAREIPPGWGFTSVVNKGLGSDNTFKIVRQGNNYTYHLNGIKLKSFADSTHNPGYIFVGTDCGGKTTQLFIDYVYLDVIY